MINLINRHAVSIFCAAVFLCSISFAKVLFASNISGLLDEANEIRTSNPNEFKKILTRLDNKLNEMTIHENYYFRYLQAYKLTFEGKFQEALPIFKNILSSEDAELSIKFRSRLTIINIFGIEQNWTKGLSQLSILLSESPKIKHVDTYLNGLTVTAAFYNQISQYELGLQYGELLFHNATQARIKCMAKTLIVESKLHLQQLKKNDSEFYQSIEICKKEAVLANFIRSYQAKFYLEQDKSSEVINFLSPHLQAIESTKYPRLIVEIYTSLAKAYWLQNDLYNASLYAEKSIQTGQNFKTTQAVVAAYKLLYQVAKAQNGHQKALNLHETHAELDKTYINETQAKHLAFQLAQHKAIEQKNQIDLLNKKNSLLTAEQALASANAANNRLIILVLALTLSVLTFWGLRLLKAHKRIKELAEYDSLTGIFNRGHFVQVANNALKYCQSAEQDLSLIMFDLDHFKKINDTFGHACGDWALQKAVEVCKDIGRQNDIFARLGGEEFCILLNSCDSKVAFERAEACRKAIAAINTADSGFDFTITASFGVTDANTSGYDLEQLLADADSAAYSSKHAGRDRTTIFEIKPVQQTMQLDDSRNIF